MPSAKRTPRASPGLPATWRFDAIGAPWQIDTAVPLPHQIIALVTDRIDNFDRTYSRFREDSLVTAIATAPGTYSFPTDATELFDLYRRLYDATDGAITPLIGRALEHLGYDAQYSLIARGKGIQTPSWDEAIAWHDGTLTTLSPVVLDVGAAGKGYLADLVAGVLRESGITEYTVDASGDIVHAGQTTLRVGLEHPRDSTKVVGIAYVTNGSLCASATNRREWGADLHHIVDVTTGLPATNVLATWAIAPTGLIADGLATALFLADTDRLHEQFDFSWVRLHTNGRLVHSTNFEGQVFQ
ncbi:MAG: FAD:protein FMN transferase [Microbacteriaceae bacterium]